MTRPALVLAALFLGAAAPAQAAEAPGNTVGGETCRAGGVATPARSQDVLCGADLRPAGSLRLSIPKITLPADPAARRSAIMAAARSDPQSALNAADRLRCDAGQEIGPDEVLVMCENRGDSWPRIVVLSATGGGLIEAEGLPGMLPALIAAIAAQPGAKAPAGQAEAGLAILRAKYPAGVLELQAADLALYQHAVELGRLYSSAGNYPAAEAAYRDALDVQTRIFGPGSAAVGQALAELGLQVSNQSRFDEAAALFRRATPIVESGSSEAARARFNAYRALNAANQRNYVDALKFARAATAARRAEVEAVKATAVDMSGNTPPPIPASLQGELAHGLRIEAEMAIRLDDVPAAQAAAEEALYIITQQGGLPMWWRPDIVSLMGEISARQSRVVDAEQNFTDAVAMNRKLFGDRGPTALAALRLGQFYADQQLYTAAVKAYQEAFAMLAADPVARSKIVADQVAPFLTAATALGDKALDAEMFTASQLVSAGVADQTIARVAAREAAADPALADQIRQAQELQRRLDGLRIDFATEQAKPDSDRDAAREKAMSDEIEASAARTAAAFAAVREKFPDYARLAEPGTVALADVQAQLRPAEAFVSFVIGVHQSHVLLVTRDGLTVRPVAASATSLADDIGDLRTAFTLRLGKPPAFSLKSSHALYRQLLGPVEAGLAGADHLIVAAASDLASLPLGLLVTSDPGDGGDYGKAAWLVRRAAISQIPSARAFLSLRTARRAAPGRPYLGIGDPSFAGVGVGADKALDDLAQVCQPGGPADAALLRTLPLLPDTDAEVRAVARNLRAGPDDVLLGAQATETALRSRPLDSYGVLYFATHGLLPGELHCESEPSLVLSPPATPAVSPDSDGLLTASEIAGFKLNADLVVLSACNTAAAGGSHFGGGALHGLADAFFNAGAHEVLASHWEVPSAETTRLMTGVFAGLAGDPTGDVAEALRQSQLALIGQAASSHPFYWAAFTLIGDGARRGGGAS
ncbi:MAG: CHAT domain-containing protein [Sphingomonadales bacterium]